MNLLQATESPQLFAPWFRDRETWAAWFAFLAALFAHQMTDEQLAIYRQCTGRSEPPAEPFTEAWLVCGRRAGKSFILALVAVFIATFRDYRSHLAPGERATIMVIAADRRQARVILRYVKGLLNEVPALAKLVERETSESFELWGRVNIEIATASFRRTRGYAIPCALLDELAFWPADEDSANPDFEIINALRPGMAQFPQAMQLCASSPYARRGALWDAFRRYHGHDGAPVLVWKAPTRTMNPTVPQRVVDEAMERDPAHAAAEFLAEFRTDVEGFLSREAVEACVERGIRERAPERKHRYSAFIDVAGGSGRDSAALCVGHREGDHTIIDCLVERKPPFSPEAIVEEFGDVLRRYHVTRANADKWGAEWVVEAFRKRGIHIAPAEKVKSDLYAELAPVVNSGRIVLLDHERAIHQLSTLERRTGRAGKDSIDHGPGGHDDVANVIAGLACHVRSDRRRAPSQIIHHGAARHNPFAVGALR